MNGPPLIVHTVNYTENQHRLTLKLAASDGYIPAGYADLLKLPSGAMYLAELWIAPGIRGHGYATLLLNTVLAGYGHADIGLSVNAFEWTVADDAAEVEFPGFADPPSRPRLEQAALIFWFERRGFRMTEPSTREMLRDGRHNWNLRAAAHRVRMG